MKDDKPSHDDPQTPSGTKGEFLILGILGVFVLVAIIGMTLIDYYGEKRMDEMSRIHGTTQR